jgi:hypothetical protein
MPRTKVVLFREDDGSCNFLDWFEGLPFKAQDKCFARLERLRALGHELRRPEADLLRDGVYELRASVQGKSLSDLVFLSSDRGRGGVSWDCEGTEGSAPRD